MKLQKKTLIKLDALVGAKIYHSSPGYQLKDIISGYNIENDTIYFDCENKDYTTSIPCKKVHLFLKGVCILQNLEMHPMGFKMYTNSCGLNPLN
jgi:hypothetical protein